MILSTGDQTNALQNLHAFHTAGPVEVAPMELVRASQRVD